MVRVIAAHAWQAQRWKNGGGVTHEVWRVEDARGLAWRLSVAEVASDGPFSRFEGLDRVIALLDGRGFELRFADGACSRVAAPLEPLAFAGEAAVSCRLLDGPVLDWNLMTRRDTWRTHVTQVRLAPGAALELTAPCVAFLASGSARLETDAVDTRLNPRDTVVLESAERVRLLGGGETAALLVAALSLC